MSYPARGYPSHRFREGRKPYLGRVCRPPAPRPTLRSIHDVDPVPPTPKASRETCLECWKTPAQDTEGRFLFHRGRARKGKARCPGIGQRVRRQHQAARVARVR